MKFAKALVLLVCGLALSCYFLYGLTQPIWPAAYYLVCSVFGFRALAEIVRTT